MSIPTIEVSSWRDRSPRISHLLSLAQAFWLPILTRLEPEEQSSTSSR